MLAKPSWTRVDSDPSLHMNSSRNSVHSSEKLRPGERGSLLLGNESGFKSRVCAELVAYENSLLKPGGSAGNE